METGKDILLGPNVALSPEDLSKLTDLFAIFIKIDQRLKNESKNK